MSAFSNTVTTRVANPSNFYDYQFCFDNSNKMSFDMTIRFFEYIEWCWHYCPFILKYISIMQPGISSGERALQNFLSWLNLLTDYSDLLGDRSIRLGKNLILLIDEIDLYLHPEWQRRFLNELITELKTHFRRFNIQIIFATHSPLCLSDVPQENTVYLRRREAGESNWDSAADGPPPYLVDKPDGHAQTFGAPVFTLLDDAFFLRGKGTMGVFAEKYINRILQDIQILREKCQPDRTLLPEEDFQEEIKRIKDAARPIGNELLQKQIALMLQWVREDWLYARRRGDLR